MVVIGGEKYLWPYPDSDTILAFAWWYSEENSDKRYLMGWVASRMRLTRKNTMPSHPIIHWSGPRPFPYGQRSQSLPSFPLCIICVVEKLTMKSSLPMLWRHIWGAEVQRHSFLISALDEGKLSTSQPSHFTPGKNPWHPLYSGLGGPHRWSGLYWRREKSPATAGISGGAVGWGTALQAGRSRVRFPMVSLEFFIDIVLPAALWPWVYSVSDRNEYQVYFLGVKAAGA